MRIITHPKKIERYHKIGLYTSLGSLVLLFGAVGLTLTMNPALTSYSFLAMLGGLILSQIGVYFANRWGKPPRIDERITQGLKGLDDRYTLYHYTTPVPHLLTGPAGVWVLVPQYQGGVITYEKDRYRQQGVNFFSKIVGQEGIGRPEMEAKAFLQDLTKHLKKVLADDDLPSIQPVIVFTSAKASVQTQEAPVPSMHVEKLKDFIRRKAKEQPANMERVRLVEGVLPEENMS
jgi:hypothetical protein